MTVKDAHSAAMDCRNIAFVLRHGDSQIPPVELTEAETDRAVELLLWLADHLNSCDVDTKAVNE